MTHFFFYFTVGYFLRILVFFVFLTIFLLKTRRYIWYNRNVKCMKMQKNGDFFIMDNPVVRFCSISPFDMKIRHTEKVDLSDPNCQLTQHMHGACEIVINLSGDVSFMVENTVYPIETGSVVITRPYEAHHCIYHSAIPHEHFWILFSSDGNEKLLDLFFDREKGQNNLIQLSPDTLSYAVSICDKLMDKEIAVFEKYSLFFEFLGILRGGQKTKKPDSHIRLEILEAIDRVNGNITGEISICELAREANMSMRTFERHFFEGIGMTPAKYIKNRRLSLAKSYLVNGSSVLETSEKCGFSDCSHFISEFKGLYGITPLQYRNQAKREL